MSTLNVNNINEVGGVDAVITAGVLDSGSLPAGSVLQVVSTTSTSAASTSSTSFTATGVAVSITPSSATSKVYVSAVMGAVRNTGAGNRTAIALFKDASSLLEEGRFTSATANARGPLALNYLDSPATTSSVAYQVYWKVDGNTANSEGPITITVMEVAA